jgi:hypothetical protein
MKKVFIIILNWNNWPDTLECLDSLKNNDYPNYQVVIVDNGSEERPEPPSPEIKMIYNQENLGFAGGNNVGIKYALDQGADYVLLLNNDTLVSQDFLTKLVEIGESKKEVGLIGGKIYFADEQKRLWFAGGQVNWLYNKGTMRGYDEIDKEQYDSPEIQKAEYLTGCCLLVKRAVIENIGLMPEDYFLYYEDVDWSLAARRAGFKCIFVPRAKIWHKCSRSAVEGSPAYIYYHIRNGLLLAQRYAPWYIKPMVHLDVIWRVLKQPIKLLIPSKKKWVKPILLGIKDFYSGKRGKI